jgi:hypothetical protein
MDTCARQSDSLVTSSYAHALPSSAFFLTIDNICSDPETITKAYVLVCVR